MEHKRVSGSYPPDVGEYAQTVEAILDNTVDGIITIDEHGTIEMANKAARQIFDYAPGEMIGENIRMLMPAPYHDEHDRYLENYRESGVRKIIGIGRDVQGRRKNGEIFPLYLGIAEVKLANRTIFTANIRDISERKRAEEQLELVLKELSHRVRNMLTVILAILRLTAKKEPDFDAFRKSFEAHLFALAGLHTLLAERNWQGGELETIIKTTLQPFRHDSNLRLKGPSVVVKTQVAEPLALILQELATNATKYGSFSAAEGYVNLRWRVFTRDSNSYLFVRWSESAGPPIVSPPTKRGFGTSLLERSLGLGKIRLYFLPGGLRCIMTLPLTKT